MIWFVGAYALFVMCLLAFSVYFNIKFGRALIKMEDALEISLDRLDERYQSVSKILEIDLFYDSPQVRQVVADIKECQESILYVANEIGRLEEIDDGEEEDR